MLPTLYLKTALIMLMIKQKLLLTTTTTNCVLVFDNFVNTQLTHDSTDITIQPYCDAIKP